MEQNQMCTKCIMDYSDPDITFDASGVCNHCLRYDEELPKRVFKGEEAQAKLSEIVSEIKKTGTKKEYDCIIGVSGGVDSTYVAYLVKDLGLRPLAIHFDNGWNSELAVANIQKTLDVLGIDLYTYVVDWEEFRDLQLSFLKASTPDGEVPTDHAIYALLFKEASRRNIRYIISGMNFSTESISVPSWAYGHSDWKYISGIQKIFGYKKLKTYPYYTFFNLFYWSFLRRIKVVSILNYINYEKSEAMHTLENKLGWVYYGGKHFESVYTRFYQGYVLPKKFGINKTRAHLSDLINSGQIHRDEALMEIKENNYNNTLREEDRQFVIKKFNLTEESFDAILNAECKSFKDYPNSFKTVQKIKKVVNYFRSKGWYSK